MLAEGTEELSQRAARSQEGLSQRQRGLLCEHSHVLPTPGSATDRRTAPLSFPFLLSDGGQGAVE